MMKATGPLHSELEIVALRDTFGLLLVREAAFNDIT
jgi:hypothetical protein